MGSDTCTNSSLSKQCAKQKKARGDSCGNGFSEERSKAPLSQALKNKASHKINGNEQNTWEALPGKVTWCPDIRGAGSVLATQRHSAHAGGSSGHFCPAVTRTKANITGAFCRDSENVSTTSIKTADSKYNYWEDGGAKEQGKVLGWRKLQQWQQLTLHVEMGTWKLQACFQGRSGLPRNICLVSSVITCAYEFLRLNFF